jgi:putative signal transducing protein
MRSEERQDQEQMSNMVEVARFESPVEAQIAKGMLESAGIESELTGENANQLIQAAFEVQLEVRAEDESAARELLQAAGEKTGKGTSPGVPELDAGTEEG